jgi:hypothetical protein
MGSLRTFLFIAQLLVAVVSRPSTELALQFDSVSWMLFYSLCSPTFRHSDMRGDGPLTLGFVGLGVLNGRPERTCRIVQETSTAYSHRLVFDSASLCHKIYDPGEAAPSRDAVTWIETDHVMHKVNLWFAFTRMTGKLRCTASRRRKSPSTLYVAHHLKRC